MACGLKPSRSWPSMTNPPGCPPTRSPWSTTCRHGCSTPTTTPGGGGCAGACGGSRRCSPGCAGGSSGGRDRTEVSLTPVTGRTFTVPNFDSSLITDLRGLARECRQLAYTGHHDKETALLSLSNRLDAHPEEVKRICDQILIDQGWCTRIAGVLQPYDQAVKEAVFNAVIDSHVLDTEQEIETKLAFSMAEFYGEMVPGGPKVDSRNVNEQIG